MPDFALTAEGEGFEPFVRGSTLKWFETAAFRTTSATPPSGDEPNWYRPAKVLVDIGPARRVRERAGRAATDAPATLHAMDMIDPPVARYAAEHTSAPGPHLAGVAAATREQTQSPGMMSGVVVARLLEALVVATRARRVLEIGTFTGYGALSIAARLPAGGTVITLEADAGRADLARRHFEASPDAAKVDWSRATRARSSPRSTAPSTSCSSTPGRATTRTTTRPSCRSSPTTA